jgi:hypothetical protein
MRRRALAIALFIFATPGVRADETADATAVQSLFNNDLSKAQNLNTETVKKEIPKVPEPSGPTLPNQRFAIGVNYTGGQFRYRLSPKWAAEGRIQFGSADSDYGTVHSNVFGLRGYRFLSVGHSERIAWYLGGEGAYAKASSQSYNYSTSGFAFGSFGGLEYRLTKRLSAAADIGPYVISLKEKETGLTSTGLDFVINTALIFYVF